MTSNLQAGIPERLTRFVQLPNEKGHNAVWDFVRSPDGRFFISVCGENEKPLTALLYEYYPDTGKLRLMFDVADVWIVDAEQMPPSKIHTSIDFLPDGKLIMATHNTAPARGHKQWMYEQHYEHPWEGYPGSIVMIVNPDTNEVRVRGIPVTRESIYGGMLGDDPRYYYFLGYMRGHFYRLDLLTNEVRDYGKVSEFSSCRLVKDEAGRLYGSSYTGGLWRYDPERDEIEDLKINFQSPNGTKYRRQFIFALKSPRNTLFLVDNTDGEMLELHPETLDVVRHGHIHLPGERHTHPYLIGGLAADDNFILYYGLKTYDEYTPIRLVRWDILNGKPPENLGLVAPGGKDSQYICEMLFDRDGWLHMVDVCGEHSPYILAVDVNKLEPPGEEVPAIPLIPYAEPNWNGVGSAAYMHIEASTTRTLPLHRHMNWSDAAVIHTRMSSGRAYTIGGGRSVIVTESGYTDEQPERIEVIYGGGAPVSCADIDGNGGDKDGGGIAILTSDDRIVLIDGSGLAESVHVLPSVSLIRLHGAIGGGRLLASDRAGSIYTYEYGSRTLCKLEGLHLQETDNGESHIIVLGNRRILLSAGDDAIMLYDKAAMRGELLPVKTPSVRGRAFAATITGGAVLADGTVAAGTRDGMLFTLTPDLLRTTCYGRLHSSGRLRNFIKRNGDEIWGVYGGLRDAGHVFHFARHSGLTDLGRPRVIKDNPELYELDSEWACIHNISCLAYDRENDWLGVASGELYGCVVRYRGVVCP